MKSAGLTQAKAGGPEPLLCYHWTPPDTAGGLVPVSHWTLAVTQVPRVRYDNRMRAPGNPCANYKRSGVGGQRMEAERTMHCTVTL